MSAAKKIVWASIAALGAVALGVIATMRGEPINAVWLVAAAACIYALGYRFYSRFLACRVLELDDQRARQGRLGLAGGAGGGSVDAFDVERRAVARGHPEAAPLPAGVLVVDAPVDPFGEEPHRVGDTQLDDLAADQRMQ